MVNGFISNSFILDLILCLDMGLGFGVVFVFGLILGLILVSYRFDLIFSLWPG